MLRIGGKLCFALVALLCLAAPASAVDFTGTVYGVIFDQQPVKGGTAYTAYLYGEASPIGPFDGYNLFTIRGGAIEEALNVFQVTNTDAVWTYGEGLFLTPTYFYAYAYVIGGTGLYANATGLIDIYGADLGGGTFYFEFTGTITP